MVGVLVDDALDLPSSAIVHGIVAQVQRDAGAPFGTVNQFHLEIAGPGADPTYPFSGRQTGPAGLNSDLVSDDKARVKAHTKLANELSLLRCVGFLVPGELAHEIFGAALGNRAEVLDRLDLAHADTVVGDGQGFGILIKSDLDLEFGVRLIKPGVVDCFKAQFVAGIRGVGDQFAQEDLFVGVQRMGHQVQQLCNFGLEGKGLFAHGVCVFSGH